MLARTAEAVAVTSAGLRPIDDVVDGYRAALDRYQVLGRAVDVGRMQVEIAYTLITAARLEDAQAWIERGIAALQRGPEGADLARAFEILGNLLRRRGASAEAEAPLRRAKEMADRVDAPVVGGHAAISLGIVLLHLGRVAEGIALTEEGWEIANRAGHLELLLRAHNAVPSILMDYAPDYERGRQILLEGVERSRRSGRRDHEAWMWSNIGNYAFDQGRIEELEHAGDMCFEIGRSQNNPYALSAGTLLRAQATFLRGDLDAASGLAEEGRRILDPREETQAVPYQHLLAAWIARAQGDDEEELRWCLTGLELAGEGRMGGMGDELLSETVRALVRRGRSAEAAPHLEELRRV